MTGTETMTAAMTRSHAVQYHAHCPWSELAAEDGLVIVRGEGVHVFDMDGRRYIDAISGGWNVALGFSAQPLVEAAAQQLRTLPYYHTLYNCSTDASVALCERLAALAPFELGRIAFSNSGSEAVEAAVKMAWLYHMANDRPERRKLLSRHGSVHGTTIFASCIGGLGLKDLFGPEDRLIQHLASPNIALHGEPGEDERALVDRLLREAEEVIAREGAETIAAMIIEPIPVVEGFHVPPAGYLSGLRAILDKHGILLIFDEVITGCGRTGSVFASEWLDCHPDLLVLGKGLTSGYAALAATLPSRRVGDAVDRFCAVIGEFPHAGTTAMHPVAMRVAAAALDELTGGGVLDHARSVIPVFQDRLRALSDRPGVSRIDGVGLGGSIHLEADDDGADRASRIARRCRAAGVLLHGQHGAIILAPPLISTAGQVNEIFDTLAAALADEG
ncbi:MAG: aspartate aminotransferase family protein [Sphingobium sp.]